MKSKKCNYCAEESRMTLFYDHTDDIELCSSHFVLESLQQYIRIIQKDLTDEEIRSNAMAMIGEVGHNIAREICKEIGHDVTTLSRFTKTIPGE